MVSLCVMIYVVLIFLGLSLGSFVNALVWRLYKQQEIVDKKPKDAKRKLHELSIVHGRSMCMHCGHVLAPKDLVPVLSWLYLKGKCRYCRKPIDDTPVAELMLPVLFVISYAAWPSTVSSWNGLDIAALGLWLAILTGFLALTLYDARWFLLPNRVVLPVTVLAVAFSALQAVMSGDVMTFILAVAGGVTVSGVFLTMSLLSKGAWIGDGDIKLGISLGLLVGTPLLSLLIIFVASLLGTLYALPQMLRGKRHMNSMLPFGPFLISATIIVFLWGNSIYAWYFHLFVA